MRRAERGFTLFEVLAAVAILGILYTTLVGWAMDGLVSEGTSRRRLEASMIADRRLAEIELGLDAGTVPPVGEERSEVDDFEVRVSVEPFDLTLPDQEAPGSAQRAGGRRGPLLAELTTDRITPLRVIRVQVAWLEAEMEFQVARTSFALDPTHLDTAAVAALLEAGVPAPEAGGGAEPDAGAEAGEAP